MIARNPLASYPDINEKKRAYDIACNDGKLALKSDNTWVELKSVPMDRVEFIAGLWRVQNKLDVTKQHVRDKDFILGRRLDVHEKNKFDFYDAAMVEYNCYGLLQFGSRYIVAKYETDKGTYWSYGTTVEQARAFLGIRLYDEYMDLIHSVACKNKNSKTK
ncbi:MAG: hypothetical protein ACLRFI_03830 [Alphaproteobacteria bacterium]